MSSSANKYTKPTVTECSTGPTYISFLNLINLFIVTNIEYTNPTTIVPSTIISNFLNHPLNLPL